MKKMLFFLFLIVTFISQAQGILFEEDLTWEQVKNKAKNENKMIFVDCYATWCGPCKEMDQTVFNNAVVGEYMVEKFISIKLQMDSTDKDAERIKLLRPIAQSFSNQYNVMVYPTQLFFLPDGTLVYKGFGFKNENDFIALVSDVNNPEKQYISLVKKWQQGRLPIIDFASLANQCKEEYNNSELAYQIAKDYMLCYLDKLDDSIFCKKSNLTFLGTYAKMIQYNDRAFKLFYGQAAKIDKIVNIPGYARGIAKMIIMEHEIKTIRSQEVNIKPNWRKIRRHISSEFHEDIAYEVVVDAQISWYSKAKMWDLYFNALDKKIKIQGANNYLPVVLNNTAWKVFVYSNEKRIIKKALVWIDAALKRVVVPMDYFQWVDTKACLLYKIGRRKEAIAEEENIIRKYSQFSTQVQPKLNLMKRGEDASLLK